MPDIERLKNQLLLDYILTYDERTLQALIENPDEVLAELGLPPDAMRCPPRAHRASRRAEGAVREVEELGEIDPVQAMPLIAEIVSRHFASPYRLAKIPFGVRFEESQPRDDEDEPGGQHNMDWTATATFQCTWSPGCGGDIDG